MDEKKNNTGPKKNDEQSHIVDGVIYMPSRQKFWRPCGEIGGRMGMVGSATQIGSRRYQTQGLGRTGTLIGCVGSNQHTKSSDGTPDRRTKRLHLGGRGLLRSGTCEKY
ncbi:hypothetical protein PspLS_03425 [Pyricularia sp. CBS 133598]|nr:hypothetical protein PspLS_03425 [Pyricularia sp. CBS 133598]